MNMPEAKGSKIRILDAALKVIRTKGYAATTIDDICAAAGLTKGGFFHHFSSKEDLAVASADYWSTTTSGLFKTAPYHAPADPLERVLAYVDFRKAILKGETPDFTCLVGTMVQEVHVTSPAIRAACLRSIEGHAHSLDADIALAMAKSGKTFPFTPASLALHTQAVIQGAFILAKAEGGPEIAAESLDHLRRYVSLLFTCPQTGETMQ